MPIIAVVASALLALSLTAAAAWPDVVERIDPRSVPQLSMVYADGRGLCSSSVILPGYLLTAAHCVEGADTGKAKLFIGTREAKLVKVSVDDDLAVLSFEWRGEKPLKLAKRGRALRIGDEVACLGYPFGFPQFMAQFGHVTHPMFEGRTVVNMDVIFGDSGGPTINAKGEIVGVNSAIYSQGPAHLGVIVPLETVWAFVNEFFWVRQ